MLPDLAFLHAKAWHSLIKNLAPRNLSSHSLLTFAGGLAMFRAIFFYVIKESSKFEHSTSLFFWCLQ
jgi:hypothetical protein